MSALDYYPTSVFKLDDYYNKGLEIAKKVISGIKGRACGKPHDYALLAKTVFLSGNGNYVETGTLFGASAIVAALIKKEYNIEGKVYCVDPFDGYYGKDNMDSSGLLPTSYVLMENAKTFGVDNYIVPISKKSYPFPTELSDTEFSFSFIDGNHWKDFPTKDWLNLKDRTTKYIMFDNYDFVHPSVVRATKTASSNKDWEVVHVSSISYILQRNPTMSDPHAWAGNS